MQTQTISAYERLHGVPEPMTEAKLWTRQGLVSVDMLREFARHGVGKKDGRHAHDIGTFALGALLRTPTCFKALTEQDLGYNIVPHHLLDNMGIFQKIIERDAAGVVTAVRPGMTQEEFLNQQGEPELLLDVERWVVSRASVIDGYYQLGPELSEEEKKRRPRDAVPPRLGMFVVDGEMKRVGLPNFGPDEKAALGWATVGPQ